MRGLDAAELEAWLSALELSAEDSAKLMAVATVPIFDGERGSVP